MTDSFARMIAGSLDLRDPWFVEGARFDECRREVHVSVGVRKDAEFVCPKCGVRQVNAPFERPHSRFTLLFEGYAMPLTSDIPGRKVSEVLRCDEKSLTSMLSHWVGKAERARSPAEVTHLAVDETSFRRGHDYVTFVVDAWRRSVMDVRPGRDGETIAEFRRKPEASGGDAGTFMRHRAGILAHFADRLTNAVCEGINSMVQAAKRKARAFRTYEGFASMICLVAGKLRLDTPSPFWHFH